MHLMDFEGWEDRVKVIGPLPVPIPSIEHITTKCISLRCADAYFASKRENIFHY